MFDVYCAHCGEPWERQLLHDVAGMGYMQAANAFKLQGCRVFQTLRQGIHGTDSVCNASKVVSDSELAGIQAAHELSDYPEEWDYYLARAIFTGRVIPTSYESGLTHRADSGHIIL